MKIIPAVHPFRRVLRRSRALQLALITLFWAVGSGIAAITSLPVPGGIIGLFLLLAALKLRLLRLPDVRRGADWFMAEMLLFFIPAMPAVIDHPEFLGWLGLKIAAVLVLGTLVVMLATAFACEACHRWLQRRQARQDGAA
ncbi:MAG: CidA/LrgA family protein [Micavibrio sp.]|nr:CidA/LrgA family protein [Micavibrio sp.]